MKKAAEPASDQDVRKKMLEFAITMLLSIDLEERADQEDLDDMLAQCNFLALKLRKLAINNLRVVSVRPAFYQKLVLRLVRTSTGRPDDLNAIPLPPTKLHPGEPVAFYNTRDEWATEKSLAMGTVRKISDTDVFVEIHDGDTMPTTGLTILKTSVSAIYEIYRKAVMEFTDPTKAIPYLWKVLLGIAKPRHKPRPNRAKMLNLNEPQQEAVLRALVEQDLAIIKGPPGTGKTRVIAEYITQVRAIVDRIGSVGRAQMSGRRAFQYGCRQHRRDSPGIPPRAQAMPNRQQGPNEQ
jgi:hypothetical protein